MTKIVITFDYPEAKLPRYKFGDRVAVTEECAPINWLTGTGQTHHVNKVEKSRNY